MTALGQDNKNWRQGLQKLFPIIVIVVIFMGLEFVSQFPTQSALLGGKTFVILSTVIGFVVKTSLLENPTLVLLGITIPIFVLTVTYVGRAAEVSKEQQAIDAAKNKAEYDEQIAGLQEQIKTSPANIKNLEESVRALRLKALYGEEQTLAINKKYNSLGLRDAVIFPSGAFLLSLLFQKLLASSQDFWYQLIFILVAITALVYGLRRIITTLSVLQEISLRADADKNKELRVAVADAINMEQVKGTPMSTQLAEALAATLKALDQQKEPHPSISFSGQKPPFVIKMNSEAEIEFSIDLADSGNKEANNVEAIFIVSPEIEILKDARYSLYKQRVDYSIPLGNSAKFLYPKVRKHTFYPRKLKIKGNVEGVFRMRYKVDCDGYAESAREVAILVQA